MSLELLAFGGGIGIAIVALSYMAGYLLDAPAVKAYAKTELGELIASVVVVVLVLGVLGSAPGVIGTLSPWGAGGGGGCAVTSGGDKVACSFDERITYPNTEKGVAACRAVCAMYGPAFIESRIDDAMILPLNRLVEAMARSSMRLSKLISYNFNYQAPIPFVNPTGSSSPGAGGYMLQSALLLGMDMTALNLLLATGIKVAYAFLVAVAGQVLLPVGILLRFIPPVRPLGNILLAITLSIGLVFPLSVIWGSYLLAGTGYTHNAGAGDYDAGRIVQPVDNPPSTTLTCSPVMGGVAAYGEDIIAYILRLVLCTGPQALLPICSDPLPVNPADPPIPEGPGLQHWVAFGVWLGKLLWTGGASWALAGGAPNAQEIIDQGFTPLVEYMLPLAVARNMTVLFMAVIQFTCSIVMVKGISQALGAESQIYGLSRLV